MRFLSRLVLSPYDLYDCARQRCTHIDSFVGCLPMLHACAIIFLFFRYSLLVLADVACVCYLFFFFLSVFLGASPGTLFLLQGAPRPHTSYPSCPRVFVLCPPCVASPRQLVLALLSTAPAPPRSLAPVRCVRPSLRSLAPVPAPVPMLVSAHSCARQCRARVRPSLRSLALVLRSLALVPALVSSRSRAR